MLDNLIFKMYVIYKTRKEKGISINKNYNTPKTGYMVGIKNFDNLKEMLKVKLEPNQYYGTWLDVKTGITYYDISLNVIDYKEACNIAQERKEIAIFDIQNKCSIYF